MPGAGAREVLDDGLDVGGLPAAAEPAAVVAATVDLGDENEPLAQEQRAGVARRDDVVARSAVLAGDDEPLDRAGVEAGAEARERDLDLRAGRCPMMR